MPRPKSKNTRQRILNTAASRFFESGFYKVSIDDLVAELRTSKSTIYLAFSSKEEIIKTVLLDLNREIDGRLESILSDNDLNYKEKFEAVTAYTGRVLSRVSKSFFRDLRIHAQDLWEIYEQARKRRLNRIYRPLIMQGMKQGILRNDVDGDFLLVVYTKMMEILIEPALFQDLSISSVNAHRSISRLFFEGALTDKGRKLFIS